MAVNVGTHELAHAVSQALRVEARTHLAAGKVHCKRRLRDVRLVGVLVPAGAQATILAAAALKKILGGLLASLEQGSSA